MGNSAPRCRMIDTCARNSASHAATAVVGSLIVDLSAWDNSSNVRPGAAALPERGSFQGGRAD